MQFWKMNKIDFAPEGSVLVIVNANNYDVILKMVRDIVGEHFFVNVNARMLVDHEFYIRLQEEMIKETKATFGILNNTQKGRVTIEPEEKVNPERVIAHLQKSKRSIHKKSNTTSSKYIFGEYKGRLYEYRTSDHDENGQNKFSSLTSLKEIPYGEPLNIGVVTSLGKVTYSTPFKTTVSQNGVKKHYVTSYVNEKIKKEQRNQNSYE